MYRDTLPQGGGFGGGGNPFSFGAGSGGGGGTGGFGGEEMFERLFGEMFFGCVDTYRIYSSHLLLCCDVSSQHGTRHAVGSPHRDDEANRAAGCSLSANTLAQARRRPRPRWDGHGRRAADEGKAAGVVIGGQGVSGRYVCKCACQSGE